MTVTKVKKVSKRMSDLTSLERFNLYYKEEEPTLTGLEKMRRFLWNPKTKEVCGRSGASWSKICLFYFLFYMALGVLVAICMWTFLQHLDAHQPKWQLHESIIGTNPGLGFRPMPDDVASSVIWYKGNDPGSYNFWVKKVSSFLTVYKRDGKTGGSQNTFNCNYNLPPPAGKVCDVDISAWGPCVEDNQFAYQKSTPCIFLKLNKIFAWKPNFYNGTDMLPESMDEDLKEHIKNITAYDKNYLNMVWVSCHGENPADRENLGPLQYFPKYRGMPGYYFPFTNQEGYLSPLVAVHLQRPKTGMLINIECRAWANNIIYDRHEGMGSVHIEVMIE